MSGELITTKSLLKATKLTLDIIRSAKKTVQEKRANDFINAVDTRLESMTPEQAQALQELWESEQGQEMITRFSDTVLQCTSKVVRTALALQFCKDKEPSLSPSELKTFLLAAKELDDDLVEFFLHANGQDIKTISSKPPYKIKTMIGDDLRHLPLKYTGEETFIFINTLIRMRFFAPDPSNRFAPEHGWAVYYGQTEVSAKFAQLLQKAKYLVEVTKD